MNKKLVATSTLIGTIIGAGFLGIPYVVSKSGFLVGAFLMFFLCFVVGITMLYLGEVVLSTKENHQLSGYANKYLGKTGKTLMFISVAIGIYSAILAYLIAEGQSFSYLFFGNTQYQFLFGILFWLLMSVLCYFGVKSLKRWEVAGVSLVLILVIGIVVYMWNKIDINNLSYTSTNNLFVPFGVILFSFLAFSIIPEIKRIIGNERRIMKWSIITAYIISLFVYLIFTFVVVGSQGLFTPEIATLGLGKIFILLGILTIFTSYLALSVALIDNLRFDYNKKNVTAWFYAIIVPLILFAILEIAKIANFTSVLGIGGVLSGGLTGILIFLMAKKAKRKRDRKPEYSISTSAWIIWILAIIYIVGVILEIFNVLH